MGALHTFGWETVNLALSPATLTAVRDRAFTPEGPGQRCMLDHTVVREVAVQIRSRLVESGHLPETAVAIQAIAFDKTPATNWQVPWHQDLMFPFARPVKTDGFALATVKDGVSYARPPQAILENLLAVRLHLDDCGPANGPLRVSPGSHRLGIIRSDELSETARRCGEQFCLAKSGEAVLMRPLLLHASSAAEHPSHRRVLHLVYHSGELATEAWHRSA